MSVDPKSIQALRAVRRMEIKSKAVFGGGFYREMGPVVLGGSDAVPDPHFNRISVLEPEKLDQAVLNECFGKMGEGIPLFIDVPHPVSGTVRELLLQNGCHPTGESRSSMLLAGHDFGRRGNDELDITIVEPGAIDIFLELFLRGFETPEDLVPAAKTIFHDLVLRNCLPGNSRLYLGILGGEPAVTLYLFYEGGEGGINMVSTKQGLRGKGLATELVRRTMEDARTMGLHLLGLETRWNSAPERLYGGLGFVTIARHEVFTNVPDLQYGL